MGFLKKKKNDEPNDTAIDTVEDTAAAEITETDAEDAEDDFSPVKPTHKKTEKKNISRSDFMAAAAENLIAATEEKPYKKTLETEDDAVKDADIPEPEPQNEPEPDAPKKVTEPEMLEDDFLPGETSADAEAETATEAEGEADTEQNTASDDIPEDEPKKREKKKFSFREFRERHEKGVKRASIIAAAFLGLCVVIYAYGCITAPKDKMGRNIYIENVNVSNMTYDEALSAVRDAGLLSAQNIIVTCNKEKFEISGVDIGLTARLEDTVDKAMRYGKTNNVFINGFANALEIFIPHKVVPTANVDEATLRAKLREFGVELYGELEEHILEIGDGVVIATPGHSGFDTTDDPKATDAAFNEVMDAINTREKFNNIAVTLEISAPRDYTAEDIDLFASLDPQNAYYALENNVISVVPNVDGRIIDKEQAAELVADLKEGGEVIYIPYTSTVAEITTDVLQAKLFNATIGSYTTSYGTSNANRCANIANAASRINGKILMPGEVFSFNGTVGPRSVANGFYVAKEYVNGETVDGIGGGTCQVSSTLYNACIYSDLSIVSRTNHMFPVGYCPLGQDATVADTGVDFKFVNSMDYPIKISASTGGYRITVSIIGTQRDDPRTVKIINSVTNVGADTKVTTTRQVYNSAGQLISTDQLPGSYYKPHD